MYKFIGLLQAGPGQQDRPGLSDGFTVNGSATLDSLAQVYGLRAPAGESHMTVGQYLSRCCCGLPQVGDRMEWERVELVIHEMRDGAVSKVRLTILELRERRRWLERRAFQRTQGRARGPRDRRSTSRTAP